MKKILFTFLMVLLAALAAQAATDYGFSVAGVTVTSDNCSNIVSNYITEHPAHEQCHHQHDGQLQSCHQQSGKFGLVHHVSWHL